jgi:hypothetical protein
VKTHRGKSSPSGPALLLEKIRKFSQDGLLPGFHVHDLHARVRGTKEFRTASAVRDALESLCRQGHLVWINGGYRVVLPAG